MAATKAERRHFSSRHGMSRRTQTEDSLNTMDILPHRVPLFRLRGRYMAENLILTAQRNSSLPPGSARPAEQLLSSFEESCRKSQARILPFRDMRACADDLMDLSIFRCSRISGTSPDPAFCNTAFWIFLP